MRLEPLYRIRFTYPESWAVGLDGGWQQMFFIAEGRCEGWVTGRFRGANFPRSRVRRVLSGQTSGPSSRRMMGPRSWLSGTGMAVPTRPDAVRSSGRYFTRPTASPTVG
jgi:hypothetical protein